MLGHLSFLPSAGPEMCTGQGAVAVLCDWEGNRRSGVALPIRQRLRGVSTYWLSGPRKVGDIAKVYGTIYLFTFTFP